MDSEVPERYLDVLLQEFAYDPVRLPLTEDPAQVLYNRTTLETIWDAKHEAVNPFTRQPFDISNVIPQTELRQEMQRYILNNPNLTLRLDVIPDYTQVLSQADMEIFMEGMISDYECLVEAKKEKRDVQVKHYWKVLWQKFNLLRLYCQYRPENRNLFCSIGGYKYLSLIVDARFSNLCRRYLFSCDVLKQLCKEVCKVVDLIGLKDTHISRDLSFWIFSVLCCLVEGCDQLKIQGMVLRIFRRMFYDLNFEILTTDRLNNSKLNLFCSWTVDVTFRKLGRQNFSDIANEDLYNGMLILDAASMIYGMNCINSKSNNVGVLVDLVILCISRLHYLHHAAITNEGGPRMVNKKNEDDERKIVELISVALEAGLSLINSIVTTMSHAGGRSTATSIFLEIKETLLESEIVTEIVRMVELVLAGFKCLGSSHLLSGIDIVVALLKEEGTERRDYVVRVFCDFLGSDMVNEYHSNVKKSLQEFMRNANASEEA